MWQIVVVIESCTLTFNHSFPAKTIDNQLSLQRKLTFRHLKSEFSCAIRIALFATLKTASFTVTGGFAGSK